MERTVRVVRVFTRDGIGGNPLGIHEGLLDVAEMQAIARALGYSETVFLGAPVAGVWPARIFTPGRELPFAGHPLVGATWHVGDAGRSVGLRCGIGVVTGRRDERDHASVEVTYQPPVHEVDAPAAAIRAWVARMPLPYEVHRLATPDAVAAYEPPDEPEHRLVWAPGDCGDAHVVRARFFAFGSGVPEDPATGSAAAALAAVQRASGQPDGTLTIHQGGEIGSPSRITLTWTREHIRIGGSVADDGSRNIST